MQKTELSDHFTIKKILLFSLPSISMQLVDNTYQVADGYFISNYISKTAFAAENMIFPPLALVMYVGLMLGSGASALISCSLGKGEKEKANRQLTLTVTAMIVLGIILSAVLYLLMPLIAGWTGASEEMIDYCVEYGRILAMMLPFQMLNTAFHPLFITADRPVFGLAVSIVNAAVNIFLDWMLVAVFSMGLFGAALATGISWVFSATMGLLFFLSKGDHLRITTPEKSLKDLLSMCYNGASEMVDAVAYIIVALLFNKQLMKYIGENGVDAYAVNSYVGGIFLAVFYGISMSIIPVAGYHLGKENKAELRSVRKNGSIIMCFLGILMIVIVQIFAPQIAYFFTGYDAELMELSVESMRIMSFSFIFGGLTTFYASFFTGMNDGTGSLVVAAVKTLIIPILGVLLLPIWLGHYGIWLVTPIAETIAFATALVWFIRYKRKGIL